MLDLQDMLRQIIHARACRWISKQFNRRIEYPLQIRFAVTYFCSRRCIIHLAENGVIDRMGTDIDQSRID